MNYFPVGMAYYYKVRFDNRLVAIQIWQRLPRDYRHVEYLLSIFQVQNNTTRISGGLRGPVSCKRITVKS